MRLRPSCFSQAALANPRPMTDPFSSWQHGEAAWRAAGCAWGDLRAPCVPVPVGSSFFSFQGPRPSYLICLYTFIYRILKIRKEHRNPEGEYSEFSDLCGPRRRWHHFLVIQMNACSARPWLEKREALCAQPAMPTLPSHRWGRTFTQKEKGVHGASV